MPYGLEKHKKKPTAMTKMMSDKVKDDKGEKMDLSKGLMHSTKENNKLAELKIIKTAIPESANKITSFQSNAIKRPLTKEAVDLEHGTNGQR